MFTKRQSDFNSESDTDNEAKDPSIKKRKSEGGLDNSKGSNLEIQLSVKAVMSKIEQAKLLRAKEVSSHLTYRPQILRILYDQVNFLFEKKTLYVQESWLTFS